ncbi:MAG: hypothetical protein JWQ76_3415 [Ramlibacter sp.]|nr:hypothetical protein [Ramlibacter sp.]
MPIVFVHGVNNRAGDEYRDNEVGRNEFLREIVAPALGLTPATLAIENPYWGGDAAQFPWGMAALPDAEESYEKFGAGGDVEAFGRTIELVAKAPPLPGGLVARARADLADAVDLLYGATLAGTTTKDEANAVALSYLRAVAYVAGHPDLSWLDQATDTNFADLLDYHVRQEAGQEALGGVGGVLDQLKEGLSRLVHAIPDAGTELLNRMARKKLNATVTRFTGDAFVYLTRRGAPGQEGAIVKKVVASLEKADAARTAQDSKLVVIAHSFGGEIVYDILTRFRPGLQVDCLVTVGSQVGLFEELKLYLASDANIPAHYPDGRVPRPANLKRWLNVFDLNDVLSYRVTPIFDGAEDFAYDTGYSTLQAHGGYFLRPSFYVRLAARLQA